LEATLRQDFLTGKLSNVALENYKAWTIRADRCNSSGKDVSGKLDTKA
jgi:hypothetical protein